ncbi:hypothetical protein [Leuconostoc pseudomesenteroides]|uniref:hypothetical protein n=1 Tax=Leuconostoc pseudomesenteroides TaxID=33968 RepID=UPI003C6D8254
MITFVNQNDRIDKRYIEKLYRQMHKYNSDVVVSDYVEYDDAKQQYKFHTNGQKKETTYSVIEWFEKKNSYPQLVSIGLNLFLVGFLKYRKTINYIFK